ncbi:MAG: hypothetical protein Q8P52_01030 [bacterium]|nr:hypothetical protein [bacterium]
MIVEETLSLFRSIIVAIILTFLISPYLVGQRQATIQTRRENEKLREELRNIRQKIDEKSQKREKTKDRR